MLNHFFYSFLPISKSLLLICSQKFMFSSYLVLRWHFCWFVWLLHMSTTDIYFMVLNVRFILTLCHFSSWNTHEYGQFICGTECANKFKFASNMKRVKKPSKWNWFSLYFVWYHRIFWYFIRKSISNNHSNFRIYFTLITIFKNCDSSKSS